MLEQMLRRRCANEGIVVMEQTANKTLASINSEIRLWRVVGGFSVCLAVAALAVIVRELWDISPGNPQSLRCLLSATAPKALAALVAICAIATALGSASAKYKSLWKLKVALEYKLFLAKAYGNYCNGFSQVGNPPTAEGQPTAVKTQLIPGRNPSLDLCETIIENLGDDPSKGLF